MADKDKQNIVKTRLLVLTKMFYEKVVKNIKKVANNVANGGKQQIHQIERNLSSNKAKKQKTLQKQKAVKLLQKGIKDLLLYKDRQGIVGEVAN